MSATADSAEATDRAEQMLGRLAELDMAAVERAHERYMAAEDGPDAAEAGRTYQRMARSLRQTLGLAARLKRERQAALKGAAKAAAPKAGGQAIAQRIRDLRAAAHRLAWNETEGEDEEELYDWRAEDIEAVITRDMLKDGFGAEPLADHVARVGLALGFDPAAIARWAELPDPPRPPEPVDLDWRGSG
jgi:hypothetical protein